MNLVAYRSILRSLRTTALERYPMTLVLQTLRSNKTLDSRSLTVTLRTLLLWLYLTANDKLANLRIDGQSDSALSTRPAKAMRGAHSHRLPC